MCFVTRLNKTDAGTFEVKLTPARQVNTKTSHTVVARDGAALVIAALGT